ncbi:MAG TPA: SDR family oxidoreductase [Anaerolineae bacterium]|nr:SDR family oxidoreductase [Anaerolineae bacterium]
MEIHQADINDYRPIYNDITPRHPELRGRVAVVTGSSRGIGKGIAARLAREGMKVVINSRTPDDVQRAAAELRELGAEAIAAPADLSDTAGVDALFEQTLRAYGTVHLLVNNAAIKRREPFFEVSENLLDQHLAANIRGPYLCAQRAAAIMRDGEGGSIVHISSIGGMRAHWRGLPYDVAKGAINAMTQAMAIELAEYGIRVNGVAPGPIVTRGPFPPAWPGAERAVERVPMRRYGHPLDIGAAVAYLASDDASYITGEMIVVDGGVLAQLTPRDTPV